MLVTLSSWHSGSGYLSQSARPDVNDQIFASMAFNVALGRIASEASLAFG